MVLNSIRARLATVFSLCFAALMAAAVIGPDLVLRAHRRAKCARSAVRHERANSYRVRRTSQAQPLIAEEREDLAGTGVTITILDSKGRILARNRKYAPGLAPVDSNEWRVSVSKLENGDRLVVGLPWAKTRESLEHHARALILLGVFVVMVGSAGAWVLVGRALRPIPLLARQARASSVDNLAVSLQPPSKDHEMVELVDTLNGLLRRITETAAAKGRFYSAASHELRTPLQALSGHLELALSRDRTKQEYKAAVEEAYAQARRLISLVRALLFLYQLDSSTSLPPSEPIDLADICQRLIAHFQAVITERGLHGNMQTSEEVGLLAPPSHIDIMVRNLVENAVKYCAENGQVDLSLRRESEAGSWSCPTTWMICRTGNRKSCSSRSPVPIPPETPRPAVPGLGWPFASRLLTLTDGG